ncbi:MAG: PAS domain S-box protein [Chitinophagaceae bacterium]|nr:PAS domain S-box protein [Chitinophagaceae bacterium]
MNTNRLLPFIISFILLVAALVINQQTFKKMQQFTTQVNHAKDVIITFEKLSNHLKSAEIYTPVNAAKFKNFYQFLKEETDGINKDLADLKKLVADNKLQHTRVAIIQRIVNEQMGTLLEKNIAEIIASGEVWRLESLFKLHAIIKEGSNAEISLLNAEERKLKISTYNNELFTIIFSIIAFGLTLTSLIYNWFLARKGKWLEGFLETILNTTQNGILHFKTKSIGKSEIDFEVDFANAAIEKQFGWKVSETMGKKLSDISFLSKTSEEYNHFFEVAKTGKPKEFEMHYEKNDVHRWFYVMLAKMENGITATLQDITEIRLNQDKLTKNIQQLEYSNTELEQYAYVASHDLQEPLRKIRIYGNFLEEYQFEKLDEKGKTHLKKITQSAERLSILIQDILNFSGIKREQVFVKTNLNEILLHVLTDLELSIEQTHAKIEFSELPLIDSIPLQINQLFYNLLVNAIKFTKDGEAPNINISSRLMENVALADPERFDKKLNYCEILVSDKGIGFSQQYALQIFGMFKRLNDAKLYPGSGIGLALCEKVVTNHNGKIFATSIEGEGTTFHIVLPLVQQGI